MDRTEQGAAIPAGKIPKRDDQEIINVLRESGYTIEHLRHRVDVLQPAAQFGATLIKLIDLLGAGNQASEGAYGVDPKWRIDVLIEQLEAPMRDRRRAETMERDYPAAHGRSTREPDNLDRINAECEAEETLERDLDAKYSPERERPPVTLARLREKLDAITETAAAPGNAFAGDYLLGMANGLILARAMANGTEPAFLEMPEKGPTPVEKYAVDADEDRASVQELLDTETVRYGGAGDKPRSSATAGSDLGGFDYKTPGDTIIPPAWPSAKLGDAL